MAELNLGKGLTAGKVASNVQKKLTRAQEKVLQKLGKADETKDAAFEEWVINFNKQYVSVHVHCTCLSMHESSRNIQSCLADMYEPEWRGHRKVESIVEDCDVLWEDYHQKLVDHALISMDTYMGQFPDIKSRIAKRDRKLVDYDSARHTYASTHKTKKKDGGIKLTKPSTLLERATPGWAQGILSAHNVAQSSLSRGQAEEELERAQKVFEEINLDLQEELPSLWNSRVGFYVSTFQSLAAFEEKFHHEMSRLDNDLHDVLVKLENTDTKISFDKGFQLASMDTKIVLLLTATLTSMYYLNSGFLSCDCPKPIVCRVSQLRPAMPPPPKVTPSKEMKTENIINLFDAANAPDINVISPTEPVASSSLLDMDLDPFSAAAQPPGVEQVVDPRHEQSATSPAVEAPAVEAPAVEAPAEEAPAVEAPAVEVPAVEAPAEEAPAEAAPTKATPKEAAPAEPTDLPPGFLFKVEVMHDYAANDTDELDMKAGDVVLVITFDNPDEQDDGWLMGIKQHEWKQSGESAAKGVFPENFTQRL
uniref:Myc box-dependent-interacting protein 1 n=1 Tax=Neogobius melanostomus TaxID=47308 RepID=A0A8C6SEW1_9GOBI